jgi:hypothetical protein
VNPRTTFWAALLSYGLLSTAHSASTDATTSTAASLGGALAGLLVAAAAGYALARPDRAGGPDSWTLPVYAAVGGALLYAAVVAVGLG